MVVRLVADNGRWMSGERVTSQGIHVPKEMGDARQDQLQGTWAEQLSELAGRVCYDSLGEGRNSLDYHRHVLDVGHLSVYEHPHFVVRVEHFENPSALISLFNRPALGVYWSGVPGAQLRIVMNLRHVLEWRMYNDFNQVTSGYFTELAQRAGNVAAPLVIQPVPVAMHQGWRVCAPGDEFERYLTFYLEGSRGFSHELVRHGDWTAISQRSTRYVDESTSEWETHPLLREMLQTGAFTGLQHDIDALIARSRRLYSDVNACLSTCLKNGGEDAMTAKKQARGAARGFLGNALRTAVIFTASVHQWRHIVNMRVSKAADAEIREIIGQVEDHLKAL